MSRFIVLSLVLTGCAIDGLYTGECTLESGDNKFIYEVEVDIDQDGEDSEAMHSCCIHEMAPTDRAPLRGRRRAMMCRWS